MESDPSRRVDGKPRTAIKVLVTVLAVCGLLAILACGGIGFLIYRLLAPTSFPAQTEDYAEACKQFRTRLVHQGPAPQPGGPEAPPPGVEELEYQSGGLRLKAWVNRQPGEQKKPAVLFLHGGFAFAPEDWDQSQPFRNAGEEIIPFDRNDPREFQMRSSLAFPQSFKCPVRLYFGNQEIFFRMSSQETARQAKSAGLNVEAVSVDGDHFTAVAEELRHCIAFFRQNAHD